MIGERYPVETFELQINNFNILRVCVGTNCPQGGDSGHGGRTILELENRGGTVWDVEVQPAVYEPDNRPVCFESPQKIRIILGGDAEQDTFAKALEFAAKVLKDQRELNANGKPLGPLEDDLNDWVYMEVSDYEESPVRRRTRRV